MAPIAHVAPGAAAKRLVRSGPALRQKTNKQHICAESAVRADPSLRRASNTERGTWDVKQSCRGGLVNFCEVL